MSVSVFMMNKVKDFKLFGSEVKNTRIYEIHTGASYGWRISTTFSEQPNISSGRYLDEVIVPSGKNQLSVFEECKVRSVRNDNGIYLVIITANYKNTTAVYDIFFADGKRAIRADDALLVTRAYGSLKQFTFEEYETRLITCRL